MFEESFRGLADLVLPSTSYLERDGTTVNLEGRLQRQRRAVLAPVPDVLAWISPSSRSASTSTLSPHVSAVFEEVSARCFGGITFGEVGERASLPPRAERAETPPRRARTAGRARRGSASSPTGRSSPAPPSSARPSSSSSGPPARCSSRARTRTHAGSANGQTVTVSSNGTSVELRARSRATSPRAPCASLGRDAGDLHADVEVRGRMTEPWWITIIKALIVSTS